MHRADASCAQPAGGAAPQLDRPRVRRKRLAFCRVNASGVLADWVEATTATTDQMTLIFLFGGADPDGSVDRGRLMAGRLAMATGARVLSVWCRSDAVADAVVAYRWLLGEGCDLDRTAFIDGGGGLSVDAVLQAVSEQGLRLPRQP